MMEIGLFILIAGFFFSTIGSASFKIRALMNKKAWGGITKPTLLIGFLLIAIGLVIILMNGKTTGLF